MTSLRSKPALPLAALALAGAVAVAAPPPAGAASEAQRGVEAGASLQAALESKTRLIKLLLAQSPAVQRIPDSGNELAKSKLAEARTLYARATGDAAGGNPEQAVKMLDEALRQIVSAARLVPDPAQLASQERSRYDSLSQTVRIFLGLHRDAAARLAAGKAATLDGAHVNGLMAKAETLAAGGKHKDANAALDEAYKAVVSSLTGMLMATTIVYDQKFASLAEEFRHELARNRSYEELVPLALAQLNTPRESAQLSERYVQQSRELRETAQKLAAGGDHPAALKTILDATGLLQRSLRVAGVIVPQAQESKP